MRRQDAKKNLASGRDGEHSPAQMAEARLTSKETRRPKYGIAHRVPFDLRVSPARRRVAPEKWSLETVPVESRLGCSKGTVVKLSREIPHSTRFESHSGLGRWMIYC